MTKVSLGTRGSDLALYQTRVVANLLEHKGVDAFEHIIKTRGDADQRPFSELTGDGFFTKELEHALINKNITFAVHSAKDLPSMTHQSLPWRAVDERASTSDVLIARKNYILRDRSILLPAGSRIGTSSPRRLAQAQAAWPNSKIVSLRGNVPTRARKPLGSEYDAVILAKAGVSRLELIPQLEAEGLEVVDLDWVTAPCQGIIGVQAHSENLSILGSIANESLHAIAMAEKTLLAILGGGCHLALGCKIESTANGFRLSLFYSDEKSEVLQFTIDERRLGDLLRIAFTRLARAPISGPKLWLTNPIQHQLKPARLVAEANFAVGSWPLIEVCPSWNPQELHRAHAQMGTVKGLAFGSEFAARLFVREFMAPLLDEKDLAGRPLFSIGEATSHPLKEAGLTLEDLPEYATAESLAKTIAERVGPMKKNEKVLIPGTDRSRLKQALEKKGILAQTLNLYATRPSLSALTTDIPQFRDNDILVFSSPSAVDIFALHAVAAPELKVLKVAAIGPSTAEALHNHGFHPIQNPQSGNWKSLIEKIKTDTRK